MRRDEIKAWVEAHRDQLPTTVAGLSVFPLPYQRRGDGAAPLGAALAEVPRAPVIRLDVEAGNKKAVAFWDKHEFRESGRKKETVAGVEISLIEMEKRLA